MKKVWLAALAMGLALGGGLLLRACMRRVQGAGSDAAVVTEPARVAVPLEAAELLYDGKLAAGWDDWGWGPHELGQGPARVVFQGFGGILFHHGELPWRYGGVAFRYKAPAAWGEFMHVSLRETGLADDAFPIVAVEARHVAALADGFREVLIPWQELNPERRAFDRVMIGSHASVESNWVELDKVMLTKSSEALPEAPSGRDVELTVQCDDDVHPISPMIYGTAAGEWTSGQSMRRLGGNTYTRLNWDLGVWNAGNDWFFENVGGKESTFEELDKASKPNHQLAMVVPIMGWVAKDATSSGFPRSHFAEQRKFDAYRPEAGDGAHPDGSPLKPLGPSQTSEPATPERIGGWIKKLTAADKARGARTVQMYILDNEPSIWNTTHRDAHPEPTTYDELLERTRKYAAAVRDADPDALIAGPAEWGWMGYLYSGKDREAGADKKPDRLAHGDVPFVAWYLQKLAEEERTSGKRLLDVLDLHYYPAASGVWGNGGGTDQKASELRLRSTRSLWDPSYRDESWIGETVKLIPRMKQWVQENYPGRKISIGEWSFGAENHVSGALATAEALGRFGQQGLDAAFYFGPTENTATYWAFRAFRNFDGKGARFQDVSIPVKEAETVSLFASRDPQSTHLVLILINREATTKATATVTLNGCGHVAKSRAFVYDGDPKGLHEGHAEPTGDGFLSVLKPFSLTVLDLQVDKTTRD
jgi:Glycoside hydrolase family 44